MRFNEFSHGVLLTLATLVGCGREQPHRYVMPVSPDATNTFVIHLQEGFDGSCEALVTVDGREVYRGKPTSNPVVGLADTFSAAAASPRPVVSFTIPSRQITWTQQLDLTAGATVGITVNKTGQVEVRQAAEFGYD